MKNKKRLQTSLGKKSLPHVNALSLSPPHLQYQLNWANGIGDINCCVTGLSISQSKNNDTWSRVFVEACHLRPVLQNESWRAVKEILVLPSRKQKIRQAGFV